MITQDQINSDMTSVNELHRNAMRSRKTDALATMNVGVCSIISRYKAEVDRPRNVVVAIRYFQYVSDAITKKLETVTRSNARMSKLQSMRRELQKQENDRIRTRVIEKITQTKNELYNRAELTQTMLDQIEKEWAVKTQEHETINPLAAYDNPDAFIAELEKDEKGKDKSE